MALFGGKKKKKNKAEEAEAEEEGAEEEEKEEKEEDDSKEGAEGEEGAEGAEGGEAAPKKSKKKLIIAVVAVLVLAGGGAGAYFSGLLGKGEAKKEEAATIIGPDGKPIVKPIFYTLPDFLVNLNTQGKASSFLKATIVIEVAQQGDVPLIEANLPRISDAFSTYLRELRPSDLAGSAGIQRLREELVLRINKVVTPVKVNDVLFKDIVVQ